MAEPNNYEVSRNVAEITLSRVRNWEDLNAGNKTEGDVKFLQKTRELWKEFAVHGVFGVDKEGKKTILNFTDLDGKVALGLLQLAGIDTSDTKYIAPSSHIEGRINLDTGDKNGVVIEDGGRTAFFDHHSDESGHDSSATKLVYEGLISVGLLEKKDYLDNMVDFVTKIDNGATDAENLFQDSYRTMIGLQRFIPFDKLLAFFKVGRKPAELLSVSDLKWLDMEKRSEQQKKVIEGSNRKLQELDENGFIVDTERYGGVVIDIGKRLQAGFDAVKSKGYKTYIIWNPDENSFFISSVNPLDISLPQGIKVRDTMWIKPRHDNEPLKITLKDVLDQLSGGVFNPQGKLKDYLEGHFPVEGE